MRGAHPGSFESAHAAVQGKSWNGRALDEHCDLVVVGAGISGLSAAYLYRRDVNRDARILILDNHDDFGGHAKRNEFELDGRTFIGYGGTMQMESPSDYPKNARRLIAELGIDPRRRSEYVHGDLYPSHGAGRAIFFDKETFGADYLTSDRPGDDDAIPLSEAGRADLKRLFDDKQDYLSDRTAEERRQILQTVSWRDFLERHAGMGEEVLTFVQRWPHGVWSIGADAMPAWLALVTGYPGFAGAGQDDADSEGTPERFYFPDGNASIARLLVQKLVPDVARVDSMDDIVAARFDYSTLDRRDNASRIRLNSTVVGLSHRDGDLAGPLDVIYASSDNSFSVTADKVIWAGYHSMLPHICPDIPAAQSDALRSSVRSPLVYTNVLIRSWRSLAMLGIRRAYCPGGFYQTVMGAHPVSMGDYKVAQSPDEPMVLLMQHIPLQPGLAAPDQFRAGRQALLETPFATYERHVREQLGRLLGPAGFDPAEDIAGITVNRWPHGYAFSTDPAANEVVWWPEMWPHENKPWINARQRIGNIAFAGTDAASNAMTEAAIEEAHRAVTSFATS